VGLFHKTEYANEVLLEVTGKKGAMVVTLTNMPYRREVASHKRKLHSDFGAHLVDAFWGKIGRVDFDYVQQVLQSADKFSFTFRIRDFAEMTLEVSGSIADDKATFESDLLDALIDAWEKNGIKGY
jgi:hypothetical protein